MSVHLVRLRECQTVEAQSIQMRHTFLNSDAHLRIVVDIGGGSVA